MRAKLLGFKLPCTEKEAIGYNVFYMDPPSAVCKDRKRLEAVCLTKRFLCARYPNTMGSACAFEGRFAVFNSSFIRSEDESRIFLVRFFQTYIRFIRNSGAALRLVFIHDV